MNKLLFILSYCLVLPLTPLAYAAETDTCIKSNVSHINMQKTVTETLDFCTNKSKTTFYSKNCKKQKCSAYKKTVNFDEDDLASEFGTPGFALCHKLRGSPQIIKFFADKKWWSLDRCIFSADNSFLDTGSLYKFYF